ncbi:HD domain-containing protein [Bailinhaonella thermotolerans]|uniref:5'-deoxynucleotidase n=1 Tax=Bailinhaonella thermotolerans TaxID=1070861 RepID=A0A3A4AUM8_9ACTN|nr:HD domain-containing protein [Bailinhaonella thermotolerans]RJL23232.1 HD domain-containing protein [Bailinhaonella thermotolerans]
MLDDQIPDVTALLYELGLLKRFPRTGWHTAGVPTPESVADHSWRVSVIAAVLAAMEGADPQRAALLAVWHDSQETRTTDLPHLAKRYVTPVPAETVTAAQARRVPAPVREMITGAVAEYEAGETPEARCARDADRLDCLLQAREYEEQGHRNVQPWIETSLAGLVTASAKRVAQEALAQGTLAWLERTTR